MAETKRGGERRGIFSKKAREIIGVDTDRRVTGLLRRLSVGVDKPVVVPNRTDGGNAREAVHPRSGHRIRPGGQTVTVWLATYVMAVLLTIFDAPPEVVWFACGFFAGAEWLAVEDGVPGNTFTEFTRKWFGHPMIRWGLGVALSVLVGYRVSAWLGIGLAIWLPLHFTFNSFEKKVLGR